MLGSGSEKSGNVAASVAVVSLVIFGLIMVFGEDRPNFTIREQALLILSVITSCLGFIYGKAGKR